MKKDFVSQKIKKILWATDFSKESRYCLPYIKIFANTLNTKNHALYVLPRFSDWVYEAAFVSDDELLGTIEKTRESSMTKIVNSSKQSSLVFEPHVIEGRITSEEISRFAEDKNVDLIFVGRRGISEIEEIIIGSTTSRLIRNSEVPVVVIPKSHRVQKIKNILCPIDFSDLSMRELEYTISLARQLNANLHVVHVAEFFNYKVPVFKRDKLIEKISEEIRKIAAQHKYKIENIVFEIGEPAKKIIETAQKNKIDIITLTTHQRKGIEKFFLGSICEKVLMYSNIPVLILPPPHDG